MNDVFQTYISKQTQVTKGGAEIPNRLKTRHEREEF
jgi:hypothetical protein